MCLPSVFLKRESSGEQVKVASVFLAGDFGDGVGVEFEVFVSLSDSEVEDAAVVLGGDGGAEVEFVLGVALGDDVEVAAELFFEGGKAFGAAIGLVATEGDDDFGLRPTA